MCGSKTDHLFDRPSHFILLQNFLPAQRLLMYGFIQGVTHNLENRTRHKQRQYLLLLFFFFSQKEREFYVIW